MYTYYILIWETRFFDYLSSQFSNNLLRYVHNLKVEKYVIKEFYQFLLSNR